MQSKIKTKHLEECFEIVNDIISREKDTGVYLADPGFVRLLCDRGMLISQTTFWRERQRRKILPAGDRKILDFKELRKVATCEDPSDIPHEWTEEDQAILDATPPDGRTLLPSKAEEH